MITSLNFPQSISWLDQYRSPDYEQSLFKGIPIAYRYHPAVLRLIRGDNELGVRLRPRYRGKSKPAIGYKRHQSYVTEEFADTFALYPVSKSTRAIFPVGEVNSIVKSSLLNPCPTASTSNVAGYPFASREVTLIYALFDIPVIV